MAMSNDEAVDAYISEAVDRLGVWDRFEQICQNYGTLGAEIAVRLEGGSEYPWNCELRYTPNPNRREVADVSLSFYIVGEAIPEAALSKCLDEFEHERSRRAKREVERTHRGRPRWDDDVRNGALSRDEDFPPKH